ncbi:hypothetical protein BKA65DRAFT_586596 [Rhexocercosporidium sp. MPI-PUGE-AT-0058]|nr:hypothetical protein BKA65DRAFT_586596 [Rhexocercosporidium sp. MPI-PUGE-AT-0058]
MRSSRCVFSSATALHRVFIAPIEVQTHVQLQIRRLAFATTPSQPRLRPRTQYNALIPEPQKRHVSLHRAEKSRLPRDDEITSWSVTLVDADGKLTDPRSTHEILSSIDRKTESLVVIVPGEPGVPPICKILNKQHMRETEKAKQKAARGAGVTQKTMELNWAIERNDLGHRMGKLRGWLEKGWRVEVVLAGKKKGRKASEEEGEGLVGTIRGIVEEVGAREMKPAEGKMLGQLTLYLEGKEMKKGKGGGGGGEVKKEAGDEEAVKGSRSVDK